MRWLPGSGLVAVGKLGPDDQKNGTDGDPTTWLPFAAVIF
jgi:hypothetical protein